VKGLKIQGWTHHKVKGNYQGMCLLQCEWRTRCI